MIGNVPIGLSFQGVYQHTLRRQLKAELFELKDVIENFSSNDPIHQALGVWCRDFIIALNGSLEELFTLRTFAEVLADLLCDPMRHSPLEASSFLGTDGQVYGEKALSVYLLELSEPYQGRSPFCPDREELFFVKPHLSVNAAVAWLNKRGFGRPLHPELERRFLEIEQQGQLPQIPTEQIARLQERVRRMSAQYQIQQQPLEAQGRDLTNRIDSLFQSIEGQITEMNSRMQSSIAVESLRDQEALEVLAERQQRWQERIQALERRNEALRSQLIQLEATTSQIEQETNQLEHAINETRIAIARREKRRNASLSQTLSTIGICAIIRASFPESNAMPLSDGNGGTIGIVLRN